MRAYESEILAMGTLVEQKISGDDAENIIKEVEEEIRLLEKDMNFYSLESALTKLNNEGYLKVSDELFKVVEIAKEVANETKGFFDITCAPLVKLWGIYSDYERVPADEEIEKILDLVDSNEILLNYNEKSITLKKSQSIDLGAIAKGYAADRAIDIYKKWNINYGYINLGGNVAVYKSPWNKDYWTVGIQDPRKRRNKLIGAVLVKDKSVVTSGNYERNFESDGNTYGHLISPKTGYPIDGEFLSVTVVAKQSIYADAFATGLFLMNLDDALEIIKKNKDMEAIFVTKDNKIYLTGGIKESFILVKDSGYNYY
jgi:thiamine biosynthesis lipoprotein